MYVLCYKTFMITGCPRYYIVGFMIIKFIKQIVVIIMILQSYSVQIKVFKDFFFIRKLFYKHKNIT